MAEGRPYSQGLRRDFIESRRSHYEDRDWGLADIARDVQRHFKRTKAPSPTTIATDLKWLDENKFRPLGEEASELLVPERFPEWRAKFFTAPNGDPYVTTKYHHALAWIIIALALKVEVPKWVLEFWGLPDSVNDDMHSRSVLFTLILLVAPRHGKSDLVQHVIIWLICENPNIRIIYCQGVLTTSQEGMEWIKSELENNDELVEWYGPFKNEDSRWNANGFTVAKRDMSLRSPTVRPVGVQSNIRSQDADLIIVDDPQDLRRASSEATIMGDYRWFTTELMTRREPHTPVFGVGSHVASPYGDMWAQLEDAKDDIETEGQKLYIRKLPAHIEDRCEGEPHEVCVVWPEYRSYEFLEAQRALLGDQMYAAVYQQEARPEGLRYFDPDVLNGWYVPPSGFADDGSYAVPVLPEDRDKYGILDHSRSWKDDNIRCCGDIVHAVGFDPAAGESKGSSESALMYKAACAGCGRRFYIDWWAKQQSPERNPDTIGSFTKSYKKIRYVRTEINAYQKSLARDPRLRKYARQHNFLIDEWRTDDRKDSPELGIPNLARYMHDGLVSMPAATQADVDYSKRLIAYYIRYPRRPDDIVMADWLCDGALAKAIEELNHTQSGVQEEWYQMPAYLREQYGEYDIDLSTLVSG